MKREDTTDDAINKFTAPINSILKQILHAIKEQKNPTDKRIFSTIFGKYNILSEQIIEEYDIDGNLTSLSLSGISDRIHITMMAIDYLIKIFDHYKRSLTKIDLSKNTITTPSYLLANLVLDQDTVLETLYLNQNQEQYRYKRSELLQFSKKLEGDTCLRDLKWNPNQYGKQNIIKEIEAKIQKKRNLELYCKDLVSLALPVLDGVIILHVNSIIFSYLMDVNLFKRYATPSALSNVLSQSAGVTISFSSSSSNSSSSNLSSSSSLLQSH